MTYQWNNKSTNAYKELNQTIRRINDVLIQSFVPKPEAIDYEKGYIPRYFVAKSWSPTNITEISVDIFDNNLSDLNPGAYSRVQINWYISGNLKDYVMNGGKKEGVLTKNRKLIDDIKKTLPAIIILKNNLLQFYKSDNLYTNGGEYSLTSGGISYVGLYHITPGIGPMVGPIHLGDAHPSLYPMDGSDPANIGNSMAGTL